MKKIYEIQLLKINFLTLIFVLPHFQIICYLKNFTVKKMNNNFLMSN